MSAGTESAKGYTCNGCGKFHAYPAYVYAHWDMLLTHACDTAECGWSADIVRGKATQAGPKPVKAKRARKAATA